MSGSMGRMAVGADVAKRPVLASYEDYLGAQKAVDTLSDKGFPVQNIAIVGVDLKMVESVMGRMSWGRAALSGLAAGAWFGLLIGLLIGLFSVNSGTLPLVVFGLVYGAAFGIIFGLVSYALTRGRRDFISRSQLVASRYDVLCEQSHLGQARQTLNIGGWPPPAPAQPTPPAGDTPPTS